MTWEYGAQVGVNIAVLSGPSGPSDSRIGMLLGGFARYGTYKLAGQPGVQFVQRGDETFSTLYLEFSGLAKVLNPLGALWGAMGEEQGSAHYMWYIGPSVSYKLSSDLDNVKSVQLGFVVGADVSAEVGWAWASEIILDGRFFQGISEVFEGSDFKNRGLSLSIGLIL